MVHLKRDSLYAIINIVILSTFLFQGATIAEKRGTWPAIVSVFCVYIIYMIVSNASKILFIIMQAENQTYTGASRLPGGVTGPPPGGVNGPRLAGATRPPRYWGTGGATYSRTQPHTSTRPLSGVRVRCRRLWRGWRRCK